MIIKKHTIISEMSWCNVLRRGGSDYRVNNFPVTFVEFVSGDLLRK